MCPRPRRRGGQSCPRRPQPASPGRLVRRSRRPDPPGRRRGRRITVRAEERPAVPGAGSPALRPRRSGEARVPVVIRPWHLVSSVPDCFMQEYSRQEYGILLISFSRLLWLLPVNGESPKIKHPEKRRSSSSKWLTSECVSRKREAPPGNGAQHRRPACCVWALERQFRRVQRKTCSC